MYFSTVTRKNAFKKDTSVRTCRPTVLSPEYALFVRLRWGGWNILLGLLGLVLPQIPAKTTASCYNRAIVESIVKEAIFTQAYTNMLPVYAYVVSLQDSDRNSSFVGSLKALIIIEKDGSYLVLTRLCTSFTLACRRTQPACAFTRTASSALSNSFSRASTFTLADNST